MANSSEVELILSLNSRQAVSALAALRSVADSKSESTVKASLHAHADNVANMAAATIEKAMQQSNKTLSDLMIANAGRAAEAMTRSISAAYDKSLSDVERKERLKGFGEQQAAFKNLDDKEVGEALTRGWLDMLKDPRTGRSLASSFSENFTKALQNIDADDFAGILKGLGGAGSETLVKMSGKKKAEQTAALAAGDAGTAMALGEAAAALSTAALAVTAIVGVLALFVAWTKAADDAQKKLNTSILEGAGASDFVSRSFDKQTGRAVTLTATLGEMRQAAYEVAKQFRFAEAEDATRILSELNQAGITYKEMAGSIEEATTKQEAFEEVLRKTITRSRILGVSTSEVATYQNSLMTELGYSLEAMDDVFGDISNAAERAGVSTKTFFTTVSQATSGMALYSVRVSEAIGFLEGFSKAIGEQDIGEFVKGLMKGPQGAAEALRDITVASKADPTALVGAFKDATGELIKDFGVKFAGRQDDVESVFQQSGLGDMGKLMFSKDKKEREELAEAIAGMSDEKRRQVMTGLTPEMAREFQKIAQLSQGTKPTIEAQGAAYFAATPALRMEMLDKMTDFFGGTDAARGDARVRAAFEQTTGKSGEELTQLFNVIDLVKGQVQAIERVSKGTATDSDTAALSEAGFTIKGKQVFRGDDLVQSSTDIYRTMDNLTDITNKGASEQEKQATKMYDAVNSIFNVLNNEIKQALFESNTILDDMFSAENGSEAKASREKRDKAKKEQKEREAAAEAARSAAEKAAAAKEASASPQRSAAGAQKTGAAAGVAASEADALALKSHALAAAPLVEELDSYWFDSTGDLPPEPSMLEGRLRGLVGSGSAQAEVVKALLEKYADAYAADEDPLMSLSTGGLTSAADEPALHRIRRQLVEALNLMPGTGMRFFSQGTDPGIQFSKIDDGFFSDGVMYQTHPRDRALFYQDGGPMDPARMAGGVGGGVVININGGDQAMVYRTVARAMRASHR